MRQVPEAIDDAGVGGLVARRHELVQEPLDTRPNALEAARALTEALRHEQFETADDARATSAMTRPIFSWAWACRRCVSCRMIHACWASTREGSATAATDTPHATTACRNFTNSPSQGFFYNNLTTH